MQTRSILIPVFALAVALPLLSGCGQDPDNQTRNANADVFDDAVFDIEVATSALPEDVMVREPQFRQTKLAEAEQKLSGIAATGSAKSQMAVRGLLAEIEKSKAIAEASDAVALWARQGGLSTRLLTLASDIRLAGADAAAHEAVDLNEDLAKARAIETELVQEKSELEAAAKDLDSKISALTTQINDLDGRRTALISKAEKLNRQAFTSKGEERFELIKQASAATTEADNLTAEREKADADRSVLQSKLKLTQTKVDVMTREDGRLGSIRAAIKTLEERDDKHKELAANARDKAQALYANNPVRVDDNTTSDLSFVAGFKELTDRQTEVSGKFAAAIEQVEAAIGSAKQGESKTAGTSATTRNSAQLDVAARQVLLGFIHQDQMNVNTGYSDLLKGIQTAFAPVTLEVAQKTKTTITEAIETADTSVTETQEKATTAFKEAIDTLDDVIESAKGDKDAKTESTAIELKISALRGLVVVTGDEAEASGVTALKNRLNELGP